MTPRCKPPGIDEHMHGVQTLLQGDHSPPLQGTFHQDLVSMDTLYGFDDEITLAILFV